MILIYVYVYYQVIENLLLPWLKDLLDNSKNDGLDTYSVFQCDFLIQVLTDMQHLLQCNDSDDYDRNVHIQRSSNNKRIDDDIESSNNHKIKWNSYDYFPDLRKLHGFRTLLSTIEKCVVDQLSTIWIPMLKISSIKSISFYYKQLYSIYVYLKNIKLLVKYQLLRAKVIIPCVWNIIVMQSGTAMIKLLNSANEQVCI